MTTTPTPQVSLSRPVVIVAKHHLIERILGSTRRRTKPRATDRKDDMTKASLFTIVMLMTSACVAAEVPGTVKECQAIKEVKKRLNCYDVAAKAAQAVEEAAQAQRQENLARQDEQRKAQEEQQRRSQREQMDVAAQDALLALKRLETRVSTGVSYAEYPNALSEAKFAIRKYHDSALSAKRAAFTGKLEEVIRDYEAASTIWS
jgi:hypothetical protein